MPVKGEKKIFWNYILDANSILLTTHVRPDGDGIASELTLYMILNSMGKKVYIVNQDKTPQMYKWLPKSDEIISLDENEDYQIKNLDLVVILDCSSRVRIGRVNKVIERSKHVISLDHHEGSNCFKDYCYIDSKASSIGELLYNLIPDVDKLINKDIATCIYVSIITDTGSFAYSNTTKNVFKIASKLLDCGVSPDYAFNMVYNNKSINHFKLLGKALELLKTDETGKIVYIVLPGSVYQETGANEEDNEGILEIVKGLKGIELIILLRQSLSKHKVKCSLRSVNSINCNHLAKMFGGGGHFKASGFLVNGELEIMGSSIIKKIIEEVKRLGWL